MAKALTAIADNQLTYVDIAKAISFTIDGVERNTDVITHSVSYNSDYGVATLLIELKNNEGEYSTGGSKEVKFGDEVIFTQMFGGATDRFSNFRGYVRQRSIAKRGGINSITLNCMDYIIKLQETDLDQLFEATKLQVTDEVLAPVYLESPNEMYASIFDFANANIATYPPPSLRIRDKLDLLEDPQFNGFEINYESGQAVLGALLNARDNFDVLSTYSFYPVGLWAEDMLEDIIVAKDGYGQRLFGATSEANLIATNLTETFSNLEGGSTDTMYPNWAEETSVEVRTTLTVAVVANATSITVTSTSGFPTTGSGTINNDTFTWTGKTGTTLTGIPASGSNALKAHPINSSVIYSADYGVGSLWYLTYNNVSTDLVASDFTIPGGASFVHFDKRFGRLILDQQIDPTSTLTCDTDYSFKTLQASGIEINKLNISEREVTNRFDAINEVRKFLAPNYLIRTKGDNKIWATYINQRITADYTLKAITDLDIGEDQDVYTRTLFFGKNRNPHNIMFDDGVAFVSTGEEYEATATNTELTYSGDDGDYRIYKTGLSAGKINLVRSIPIIYIDGYPIDNNIHEILNSAVTVEKKQFSQTETSQNGRETEVNTRIWYNYRVYFSHTGLVPSEVVKIYNAAGALLYTLGPNSVDMNYEEGSWRVPGESQNSTVEQCSSADYWIMYSTGDVNIDYDKVEFRISRSLVPEPGQQKVTATFDYFTVLNAVIDAGNCFDGRYDTQTQSVFYAKPPSGYIYAIIDLGQLQDVQAIDIIAGFYRPYDDPNRKIDMTNYYTLEWSLDGVNFFNIAPETNNFSLSGGDTISWDTDVLGESFQARYFKLIIEDLEKIEYNPDNRPSGGVWVVALTEIMAFGDIVLKGEGKLIPTTELTANITTATNSVPVLDTSQFPSGASTIYVNDYSMWYSSKTATSFEGCTGSSNHSSGMRVHNTLEDDTSFYDDSYLLEQVGDVVYKDTKVNDYLDTQEKVDSRAKDFLAEFYKNHTKSNVNIAYAPYIQVGHTVELTDALNRITKRNYFVDSIIYSDQGTQLTLAYYP